MSGINIHSTIMNNELFTEINMNIIKNELSDQQLDPGDPLKMTEENLGTQMPVNNIEIKTEDNLYEERTDDLKEEAIFVENISLDHDEKPGSPISELCQMSVEERTHSLIWYWKFKTASDVHSNWNTKFNTVPPSEQMILELDNHFKTHGSVLHLFNQKLSLDDLNMKGHKTRFTKLQRIQVMLWYYSYLESTKEVLRLWKEHYDDTPPNRVTIRRLRNKFLSKGFVVEDRDRESKESVKEEVNKDIEEDESKEQKRLIGTDFEEEIDEKSFGILLHHQIAASLEGSISSDVTNDFGEGFRCPYCQKWFRVKGKLRRHVDSVHLKIKRFVCPKCPARFTHKGNLKQHINSIHFNLKRYKCPECSSSFNHRSNLNQHLDAIHHGLKPFECPECPEVFSIMSNLTKHLKAVHHKLKPFKCPQCATTFTQKANMKRHIASVHYTLKPHKCHICGATFTQKAHLNLHNEAIHLKLKPYKCIQCEETFSRKVDLRRHVKTSKQCGNISDYLEVSMEEGVLVS